MDQNNNNNNNSNNNNEDKYKNWYEIRRDFERGGDQRDEQGERESQEDGVLREDDVLLKEEGEPHKEGEPREEDVSYFRYGSMPDPSKRADLGDAIELPATSRQPEHAGRQPEQEQERRATLVPSTAVPVPFGSAGPNSPAAPNPYSQPPAFAQPSNPNGASGKPRRSGRSSWKGMFASFMAGVVVVGSLMFVSDRFDLFTTDQGVFNSPPSQQQQQQQEQQQQQSTPPINSGLQNTSLEVVRPNTIAAIATTATPAVVKIETYSKASQRSRSGSMFDDPLFNFFFGEQDRGPTGGNSGAEGSLVQTGTGSGFLFDPDGYILTNQHVLEGADEIRVYIEGYSDYFVAEQLGDSFDLDLAAIKITGSEPFPYLQLGDADKLNVGDWVIAIGNPYGFDHTVTVGVLSAKERAIPITDSSGTRNYKNLLQTDASINPGNSGGPLLNLNGEVVGINTAVNSQAQGIGFAIPTSTVSVVLDNLKNDTPIPKEPAPYIGVYIGNVDSETAEKLDYRGTDGAIVSQVELRSPAHLAGLQNWDIITELNGQKIKTSTELTEKIKALGVGDTVKLKVFRLGQTLEIDVTIGDRNAGSN